jgi:hypothetical protein
MEKRTNVQKTPNTNTLVEMDLDIEKFFDSNEVWKPLTEGLGFNENRTQEIKPAVNPHHNSKKQIARTFKNEIPDSKFDRGDLAPFYTSTEQTEVLLDQKVPTFSESIIEAEPVSRILAWVIDITFILALVSATFIIVHLASGSMLDLNFVSVFKYYLFELIIPSFCMFYLFYFTILDRTVQSTVGKNILGLTVKSESKASIFITLRRSILSLCSIGLLFIPTLFGVQDKFTGTKVVKTHGQY